MVAALLMLGTTLLFTVMDSTAKQLGRSYPVVQVVWARYAFHLVALLPFALAGYRLRGIVATRRPGLQIGRSLLLLVSTLLYFLALRYISLAEATALAFVSPLVVTALAAPLLGEHVDRRRWTAVAIGFAGAVILIRPGFESFHWAIVLPLVVGFTRALYMLATRALGASDQPFTTLFYSAALGCFATSVALPFEWRTPDAAGLALMIALGATGAVSTWLMIRAYALAPSAQLAPFSYVELAWATLAGFALFGELPDRIAVLGATLIAASGLYVLWPAARRRPYTGQN